jgi:ribosome-associated translation inhibitor RaiA
MKTKPSLIRFQPSKSVGRRRDAAAARASTVPEPGPAAVPAPAAATIASGPELPAVQTSFRHMAASAAVTARIEAEVEKLQRFFDGITHCHVVVIAPHRHHRAGRRFALHIELGVPRERLVIAHETGARPGRDDIARPVKSDEVDAPHKDVYVAVRDAFATARRQLKDYVQRLRGEVKRHRPTARPRRVEG